jgi:NAD(P) transhydrogenase subunit alpha
MKIALFKESRPGETRVALTPDAVKTLVADGWSVDVEGGAGQLAHFDDESYRAAGATIVDSATGDVNLRVNAPTLEEVARVKEGSLHLSFLSPLLSLDVVKALNERKVTIASFDLLPRISRAQYMDALSSQRPSRDIARHWRARRTSTVSFRCSPRRPARFARPRYWSWAWASRSPVHCDVQATWRKSSRLRRAQAAKEEAESAGAVFVQLGVTADGPGVTRALSPTKRPKQQRHSRVRSLTRTSSSPRRRCPGEKSPILVTTAMVEAMGEGSLVIDMAADGGGNCELTKVGEVVEHQGVRIVGLANPPSQMGASASFMYANNVLKLLGPLWREGRTRPDWNDESSSASPWRANGDQPRADRRGTRRGPRRDHVPEVKESV